MDPYDVIVFCIENLVLGAATLFHSLLSWTLCLLNVTYFVVHFPPIQKLFKGRITR